MNKQSTKPIFIETEGRLVPVDGLGQGATEDWVGLTRGGNQGTACPGIGKWLHLLSGT